jgi:hypothetical protein
MILDSKTERFLGLRPCVSVAAVFCNKLLEVKYIRSQLWSHRFENLIDCGAGFQAHSDGWR